MRLYTSCIATFRTNGELSTNPGGGLLKMNLEGSRHSGFTHPEPALSAATCFSISAGSRLLAAAAAEEDAGSMDDGWGD